MIEPISVCDDDAGKPEPPGAEIPDDRRDQQREDHGEAGAAADLQDQLDRQQRDDAERDRAAREQHAEEVEHARPDDREVRRQRVRVDDSGDGIGGVVEAIDELEAERDQQRDTSRMYGTYVVIRPPAASMSA